MHFVYLHSLVKTLAKFVRILEQSKTLNCISGIHWSALKFSQSFASVFTGLEGTEKMFYFLTGYYKKNQSFIKLLL